MNGEYLVVTYVKEVEAVTRVLSDAGMHIAYASGQKLQDLCVQGRGMTRGEKVWYTPGLDQILTFYN